MKTIRFIRFAALFLALLMLPLWVISCAKQSAGQNAEETALPGTQEPEVIDGDGFVPVLRFAVSSDIHTRSKSDDLATLDDEVNATTRLSGLFSETYAYAQSNPYYKKLDAVVLVGDYTDYGYTSQYNVMKKAFRNVRNEEETQLLGVLGNHEFWAGGEMGTTATTTTRTYAAFRSFFGSEPDWHIVINGYHFIGISPDAHGGRSYSIEKSNWLKTELAAAAADDPTKSKPIFVYMHMQPNDLDADETYSTKYINSRLSSYPQVVVFAGHTHQVAVSPRCISQDNYTLINTGTMANCGYVLYTNDGSTATSVSPQGLEGAYNDLNDTDDRYKEHGEKESALYLIVEVDKDGHMRLRYYDLNAGCLIGDPIVFTKFGNRKQFEHTASMRRNRAQAPYWEEGSEVTLLAATPTSARLSFPQAKSKDMVQNYRIDFIDESNRTTTVYRLSRFDTALAPENILVPVCGLTPNTTYEVKIYGYNGWGQITDKLPLSYTFKTPADTDVPEADVFSAAFTESGATNAVTGTALVTNGAVQYVTNDGHQAAGFRGESSYQWREIDSYYDMMRTSVSLEAYVKVTAIPDENKSFGIISNYNPSTGGRISGGMSLEYAYPGQILFRVYLKNIGVCTLRASMRTNRFVHVVATYDGSAMRIYLDGELAASTENQTGNYVGSIWFPRKYAEQYLVVGAMSGYNYATSAGMNGLIAAAGIYSRVLDEDQIRALYNARSAA